MEMDERQEALRGVPQVDALLRHAALAGCAFARPVLLRAAREELEALRTRLLAGGVQEAEDHLAEAVLGRAKRLSQPGIRRVINATGIVLHTNLGRAPLCAEALQALDEAAGYSTLEYDLEAGARGSRCESTEALLCELTGAEAALLVNNNAAAVLLALAALVEPGKRDILVSRGELVEIGNSFRVPDIMTESGGMLTEVGMTNKTHLHDYEAALSAQTAAMLKVHTSNYRIVGFSSGVSVRELSELGRAHGVPVLYDLGSGALLPQSYTPFLEEPTVPQALEDGADIITFSGDKLLGGPQAGIILGKSRYLDVMRRRPLARALRPDKLTLAALEATLRLYREPERALRELPVLRVLGSDETALWQKAERLAVFLRENGVSGVHTIKRERLAGGGSMPGKALPGAAVAVPPSSSVQELERCLRMAETPIIACISGGELLLDVSTVEEAELELLAKEVAGAR